MDTGLIARWVNADGKQMKINSSIKLNGTVIGGNDAPLHKLDRLVVTRQLLTITTSD